MKLVKPQTSDMEVAAQKAFIATGELSSLASFADWVEEYQPERTHFAHLLREAGFSANDAIHWFFLNHSSSVMGDRETVFQGRLRSATEAAWAESYIANRRVTEPLGRFFYTWNDDMEEFVSDERSESDHDQPHFYCQLIEVQPIASSPLPSGTPMTREVCVASLADIDLGDEGYPPSSGNNATGFVRNLSDKFGSEPHPYCRSVMAELALEVEEVRSARPNWCRVEDETLVVEAVVFHQSRANDAMYYAILPERPHRSSYRSGSFPDRCVTLGCIPVSSYDGHTDGHGMVNSVHAVVYSEFSRNTEPVKVDEALSIPQCRALVVELRKQGIRPQCMDRPPRGYHDTHRKRWEGERTALRSGKPTGPQ